MNVYIINICAAALVGAVCQILMPSGKFAKYVKFICGITLACVMLSPLAGMSFEGLDFSDSFSEVESGSYEEKYQEIVLAAYEEDIKKDVLSQPGVTGCEVTLSPQAEILSVCVTANAEAAPAVRSYLSDRYEIGDEKISIWTKN